jgi:hypothetical protein
MARLTVFSEHVLPGRHRIDRAGRRYCSRWVFDTAAIAVERDVRRDAEITAVSSEIPTAPEQGEPDDRPHDHWCWLSPLDGVTWLTPDGAVQALDI